MLVKFFAYYREPRFAGCKTYEMEPRGTVREVLLACCERWPGFAGELLVESREGELQLGPDVIVMVNGRGIEHMDGAFTRLQPTDTVAIFPRCAGG